MSDTNEVGCQIILTTGEHIGECKGTCGPQASDFSDTTHDDPLLARIIALEAAGVSVEYVKLNRRRIDALEAQVREMEAHQHAVGVGGGISTTPIAAPKANADNAPKQPPLDNMGETQTVLADAEPHWWDRGF